MYEVPVITPLSILNGTWGWIANTLFGWLTAILSGLFIQQIDLSSKEEWARALKFLNHCCRRVWSGKGYYGTGEVYISSERRRRRVAFTGAAAPAVFLLRGRPLLLTEESKWRGAGMSDGGAARNFVISFIRWTFNVDALVEELLATDLRREHDRYTTKVVSGGDLGYSSPKSDSMTPDLTDFGSPVTDKALGDTSTPFGAFAMEAHAGEVLEEGRRWLMSREWFVQRRIPWRRGWELTGSPGTGKTSFARAAARELNLPVFRLDLSDMNNRQLRLAWAECASSAPAMILLEDFDSIFKGRDNVARDSKVTFDCLLNLISGLDTPEGLLLVITTNHPESLDPALVRPGRVDRVVPFGPMAEEQRRRVAARILEGTGLIDKAVVEGEGDTGAAFENRCTEMALAELFKEQ